MRHTQSGRLSSSCHSTRVGTRRGRSLLHRAPAAMEIVDHPRLPYLSTTQPAVLDPQRIRIAPPQNYLGSFVPNDRAKELT